MSVRKQITITPSPRARLLFGRIVARSEQGRLPLAETIALSADLARQGRAQVAGEVIELQDAGWIQPDPETSGWRFSAGTST